jgi:NitT/TauT family transport system substrate-binding protein
MTMNATMQRVRFLLNWKFQGPNAPFLLAEDAGYFREEGLTLHFGIGEGSSAIPAEIQRGAWDAGFGDVSALIEQHAANPASDVTTLYSIYDRAPMVVISKTARGLKTPQDLIGKTLSSPAFDTGFLMFPAFARAAGIDAARVNRVPAAPAERDAKLIADEIDGAMGFDATLVFALRALRQNTDEYSLMYYADAGLDVYSSAVMASRSWLAKNAAAGRGLVRAINRGWLEAMSNPEAAVDAVLRRDPAANRSIVRDHLQWVIDHQVKTPSATRLGIGAMEAARIERNIDVVMAMLKSRAGDDKTGKVRPGMITLYDGSFLPPLAERAV